MDGSGGVPAVEKVSTTEHTITIGGKEIAYTANTGTMVLRGADGKPNATVFYIAYTKDREQPGSGPSPSSSTVDPARRRSGSTWGS